MIALASQVKTLFEQALDLASPSDRAAFLDQACGGDSELRANVESLLRAHDEAGRFLDPAGIPASPTVDFSPSLERAGSVLGPYKLLEQIGEGGMGLVFMAEQLQPVRRKVALKILKPGMDTRQVVARFEAERQALALMDHPHIAKVFDAGATASGRPYFVMELVRGVPITEFCDQRRLTTRQRLELFALVCQAVQHAHQKGIIHRDLKPSNVLVTLHDTVAVPKVIDFGIAKATGQQLTERTLFTHFAQMVGTPLYMSPEQAEMNGLDVDTRSDVYSLGVLLYELLTGTTPFESESLRCRGLDEMRRMLREDEPPRPSHRVSTLVAQACSTVSERRGVDGRRLGQLLRGELDWIVMKALEKDRNRRYESASALAADVQRYLHDEPVEACPPSAGYRLRKYARRNRRLLVTAGLLFAVLVAGTAVSVWQAIEAHSARRLADRRLQNEKQAKQEAATEAAIARAVNDFLQRDLLRQADIDVQAEGGFEEKPNLTVKEALNRAAARMGDRFRDQPLIEAAIRATIGDAYRSIGDGPPAVTQFERALALRQSLLGTDHPDTLDSMDRLANAYLLVGRWLDAVAVRERVVGRRQSVLGPDHDVTLEAMSALAGDYARAKLFNKSLLLRERLLEKRRILLGPNHPETLERMKALATLYPYVGRFEESLALHEATVDLYKAIPGPHQNSMPGFLNSYARACAMAGKFDQAERVARESVQLCQQQDGTRGKNNTAVAMEHLAPILLKLARFEEAESIARQVQAYYENDPTAFQGPNNYQRFHAMSVVGGAMLGQKRYAEAEPLLLQGYEGLKQREAAITISFEYWLTAALERVIQLYEATDQPGKARVWRAKLAVEKREGP